MFGNWMKTGILMAGIMALLGVLGHAIAGPSGVIMFLIIGALANFFAYWFSDKIVLRMYRAQEVNQTSGGRLYAVVKELAGRAQLPMPRVYLIDEDQPNAFATGRNPENAALAATTGILRILTDRELRGVMAHELAHVKHRDILTSTISATIAGAVSSIAQMGLFFGGRSDDEQGGNPIANILLIILAPIAAMLIQFAISRTREFEADRGGAEICRDPLALASALEKIHRYAQGVPMPTAEAHPATAQMMIVNPLAGGGLRGLFSTHPDTRERIARLEAMARAVG